VKPETAEFIAYAIKLLGDADKGVHAQPLGIFDCNSLPCVQSFQKSLNLLDAR